MSKTHYERLIKKYGEDLKGEPYRFLAASIISKNSLIIMKKVYNDDQEFWKKALKKVTTKEKVLIMPKIENILPGEGIFLIKAADQGKILSDRLKENLTKDLRKTLNTFTPKTDEPAYVLRKGKEAGRINPKLVKEFEQRIKKTFVNYTKKHPKMKVPKNINQIAVTEMGSVINNTKVEFKDEMVKQNPELVVRKIWIQYPSLSKEPRLGHRHVSKLKPKPHDFIYKVPRYKKIKKRWVRTGIDLMPHPHFYDAPPEQTIGCSCEVQYFVKWSK
jgi:hypothetical protein